MTLVPTTKLIILTAAVFLPLSVLVALMPALSGPGTGLAIVVVMAAAADAVVSRHRLAGIRVSLPAVVRLSAGREGEIALAIENIENKLSRLRLGIAFPREIYSVHQDLVADLPAGTPNSQVAWPFKALKQGLYLLENCHLESPSRLGLWALRETQAARTEIRVYPDILRERRKISGLFLNRGFGRHAQRQVGKGREFEQLREYLPGDSYEDIHWKATARRGAPIPKSTRSSAPSKFISSWTVRA